MRNPKRTLGEHWAFSFLSVLSCCSHAWGGLGSALKPLNVFQGSETLSVLHFPKYNQCSDLLIGFNQFFSLELNISWHAEMGSFNPETLSWCLAPNKFYRKVAERGQSCWRWCPFPQVFSVSLNSGFFWDLGSWKAREQHCPKMPLSVSWSPDLGHILCLFAALRGDFYCVFDKEIVPTKGKPLRNSCSYMELLVFIILCLGLPLSSRWALC